MAAKALLAAGEVDMQLAAAATAKLVKATCTKALREAIREAETTTGVEAWTIRQAIQRLPDMEAGELSAAVQEVKRAAVDNDDILAALWRAKTRGVDAAVLREAVIIGLTQHIAALSLMELEQMIALGQQLDVGAETIDAATQQLPEKRAAQAAGVQQQASPEVDAEQALLARSIFKREDQDASQLASPLPHDIGVLNEYVC